MQQPILAKAFRDLYSQLGRTLPELDTDLGIITDFCRCTNCGMVVLDDIPRAVSSATTPAEFMVEVSVAGMEHLRTVHGGAGPVGAISELIDGMQADDDDDDDDEGDDDDEFAFEDYIDAMRGELEFYEDPIIAHKVVPLLAFSRDHWQELSSDAWGASWGEAMKGIMRVGCEMDAHGHVPVVFWPTAKDMATIDLCNDSGGIVGSLVGFSYTVLKKTAAGIQQNAPSATVILAAYSKDSWAECKGQDEDPDQWLEGLHIVFKSGCMAAAAGQTPVVVWVQPKLLFKWLAQEGLSNNAAHRAAYAGAYFHEVMLLAAST